MARVNGDVWDALAGQLSRAEKKAPGILDKAIQKAAQIYVDETQKELHRMRLVRTGALAASVKKGPIRRLPDGRSVEVWPQGKRHDKKHPRGERNETIGYVLIHGRPGKYRGRDYLTAADQKADARATQAIADMLQEVFDE